MNEKIKILTVTHHRVINYGALLQAYALHKTLISLGYDNKIFDLQDKKNRINIFSKNGIKITLAYIIQKLLYLFYKKELDSLKNKFKNFLENNISLTSKCNSIKKNRNIWENFDLYLTGSDQVFSLNQSLNEKKAKFLDFPLKIRKISYAASFSNYKLSKEEKEIIEEYLKDFLFLSLREKEGEDIVKDFNNNTSRNIDPVFLIEEKDWENLSLFPKNLKKEEYILYFQVNSNPNAQKMIDFLKKIYNLPVVCVQTTVLKRVKVDKYIFNAGIEEFLGLIKNAKFVLTTSFHGTAFSIIFQKNFCVLTKENSNPYRIEGLLKIFNLENRLIKNTKDLTDLEIDYKNMSNILKKEREKSFSYLKNLSKFCKNKND